MRFDDVILFDVIKSINLGGLRAGHGPLFHLRGERMMKLKAVLFSIVGIVAVVGLLAGTKVLQISTLIKHKKTTVQPPEA